MGIIRRKEWKKKSLLVNAPHIFLLFFSPILYLILFVSVFHVLAQSAVKSYLHVEVCILSSSFALIFSICLIRHGNVHGNCSPFRVSTDFVFNSWHGRLFVFHFLTQSSHSFQPLYNFQNINYDFIHHFWFTFDSVFGPFVLFFFRSFFFKSFFDCIIFLWLPHSMNELISFTLRLKYHFEMLERKAMTLPTKLHGRVNETSNVEFGVAIFWQFSLNTKLKITFILLWKTFYYAQIIKSFALYRFSSDSI